jgi:hypothetical protein
MSYMLADRSGNCCWSSRGLGQFLSKLFYLKKYIIIKIPLRASGGDVVTSIKTIKDGQLDLLHRAQGSLVLQQCGQFSFPDYIIFRYTLIHTLFSYLRACRILECWQTVAGLLQTLQKRQRFVHTFFLYSRTLSFLFR